MKFFDLLCAGSLFLLAIAASFLIPKAYTGRIWIFGTDLALLFSAMLNLLRIQNGSSVRGLKMFCVISNVSMLAFFIALMASIGMSRTVANAQIPVVAGLLLLETGFSLKEKRLIPVRESADSVTFAVKVHPGANKNAITGELGDALKVSLTAAAEKGRANEACVEFFAKLLKVPRSSVTIASGQTTRNKVIRVAGVTGQYVRDRLFG
ncbi:MAG TPA: DUF167 domain-containing protein [Candidatus Sulfotelmatobacter sp.]|jgi:hypothetical protein|nr:DUF167 domain-containing protein [Candidatus Sulfotelmatobacter sp.]